MCDLILQWFHFFSRLKGASLQFARFGLAIELHLFILEFITVLTRI